MSKWVTSFLVVVAITVLTCIPIAICGPQKFLPKPLVKEYRSADGRVVCYRLDASISCLPAWLLDRPGSWYVVQPKKKGEKQ